MKTSDHQFTLLWALLFVATIASGIFALLRLQNMPVLPVTLGPELHVRSVLASDSPERGPFQRNDRVVALRGRSLEDLRELRAALESLPGEGSEEIAFKQLPDGSSKYTVNYQIVRPLHRFNLLLQGEPLDPSSLPPGVEEGDQLVELDGRPMRPRVRTEGLRNIISSRPEALLVFERPNAVFTGEVELKTDPYSEEVLVSFLLAFVFMLLFWRKGHRSLSPWTSLATGLQTLAFAWISVFIFTYQWVLADYFLVYATIVALIMTGPLGIFARTASAQQGGGRKWGSLAVGVIGALIVIVALSAGRFQNPEVALQFAAFLGTLFVVFEVILTGLNEGAGVLLGERSKFLSFIIFAILIACMIAYVVEPIEFVEEHWRWFVAIVLGLVWIGDAQLCLGGLPMPAMAELASPDSRHHQIEDFLTQVEHLAPGLQAKLVVFWQGGQGALTMSLGEQGQLDISESEQSLADTSVILFDEGTRIPAPQLLDDDLGQGLAETMGIRLALPMQLPEYGLDAEDLCIMLLATRPEQVVRGEDDDDEDTPEPVQLDVVSSHTLDELPELMTSSAWAAVVIEALSHRSNTGMIDNTESTPRAVVSTHSESEIQERDLKIQELNQELEVVELRVSEKLSLKYKYLKFAQDLPDEFEHLLEEELVDALTFLQEEDSRPIVLSGPQGAGKSFVAEAGHRLEGREAFECLVCDASLYPLDELEDVLLGSGDERGSLLQECAGGSLILEHAGWFTEDALMKLSEQSERFDVRLYLCFEHPAPEQAPSILEAVGPLILELLGDREIMIPALFRRVRILPDVLAYWLEEISWRKGHPDLKVSPEAHQALLSYGWPGHLEEMKLLLGLTLERLEQGVLEREDLLPMFDTTEAKGS